MTVRASSSRRSRSSKAVTDMALTAPGPAMAVNGTRWWGPDGALSGR
jgi:hypothetical protein